MKSNDLTTLTNFYSYSISLLMQPDLVPCKLVEFDHLISKAKLGDDEDFKDFVNPSTRKEVRH